MEIDIDIDIDIKESYHKDLAYAIIEAEKSHSLLSASRSPIKACSVVPA